MALLAEDGYRRNIVSQWLGFSQIVVDVDISGADPAIALPEDIFYHIGTKNKTVAWSNPFTAGDINIYEIINPSTDDRAVMVDRETSNYESRSGLGRALVFDFDPHMDGRRISPTGFFFQHGRSSGFRRLRTFSVYGSNGADVNNTTPELLLAVDDSNFLPNSGYAWSSFTPTAAPSEPVRFLEIFMDGNNVSGSGNIVCSELLLQGTIFAGIRGY
ncbi:MAG: hypothetical protein AAGA67_14290 [Cyanobacteria bacterium P01_F01_bin.153]